MARPLRLEFPGAWHHVMNRGANRQPIYLEESDQQNFLSLLDECHKIWSLEVHAYALMPNHYHLLAHTPEGNLSEIMRYLDGVYTQRFNRRHQRDGALFRGRYKAILVDADSYLLQVARYIHLNPIKARLCELPQDFPWSSYRFYLNPRESPRALIRSELLGLMSQDPDDSVGRMVEFTLAGVDEETEQFYGKRRLRPFFAKKGFMERLKIRFSGRRQDPEIPDQKDLITRPTMDKILGIVCEAYEVSRDSLTRIGARKTNRARSAAIYLSRMLGGWPLPKIGQAFGGCGNSAVSNTVSKVKRQLKQDTAFLSEIQNIENVLINQQANNLV